MRKILKSLLPPIVVDIVRGLKRAESQNQELKRVQSTNHPDQQDLDIYWTSEMANQLEEWGKDHAWIEIECLLINCKGKVLDIACGTGVNIKALSRFSFLDLYGFDISDKLLEKAKKKGIDAHRLRIMDATKTSYDSDEFDYSYSIGSLEHFTEDGISLFLEECSRYTRIAGFHMIPVSEDNHDHGWIIRGQSYFNNSIEWWLAKFESHFSKVHVLNSGWKDPGVSRGKWFICYK